jgi:hypothetical protein
MSERTEPEYQPRTGLHTTLSLYSRADRQIMLTDGCASSSDPAEKAGLNRCDLAAAALSPNCSAIVSAGIACMKCSSSGIRSSGGSFAARGEEYDKFLGFRIPSRS